MRGNVIEAIVGAVVITVSAFSVYYAYISSGRAIKDGYVLTAKFDDVSGLSVGSDVKLNGIKVGSVQKLAIDESYQANVEIMLKKEVTIPNDSSLSVTTDGIMGNRFVAVTAGYSKAKFKPGEEVTNTQSSVNIEKLINKFAVGGAN